VTRLETMGGFLYGLCEGNLFMLDNSTYMSSIWVWRCVNIHINRITFISATGDGAVLFIQTPTAWYHYYGTTIDECLDFDPDIKRIYGFNISIYIDINIMTSVAKVHPHGKIYNNIRSAVITHDSNIVFVHTFDDYHDVRLVNWKPYFVM
jgi:glycerophosphoryl diester phosphodiesterase